MNNMPSAPQKPRAMHQDHHGQVGRWRPRTTPLSDWKIPKAPPWGKCIRTLSIDDKHVSQSAREYRETAKITNCSVAGSYTWLSAKEPTILIPGTPPRWTPPVKPEQLSEDVGAFFRDRNAAHFPAHPLEPAITSVMHVSPNINRDENIDIVACASTLGNLFRFVRNDGYAKSFRMLVEKVGDTVFFTRRENSPSELIPGVRGYGHTFPEAYTTWDDDLKGSEGHHRVVGYKFGGMKCLVSFEVDGYMAAPDKLKSKGVLEKDSDTLLLKTSGRKGRAWSAGLLEAMEQFHVSGRVSEAAKPREEGGLGIRYVGEMIPQSMIFELKTRTIKKAAEDIAGSEMPRFWVRQVPSFILGFHTSGLFEDIRVIDVRNRITEWEKENADVLAKLAALIRIIVEEVGGREDKKIELCHLAQGKLEIREQLADAGDILSAETKRDWEARVLERGQHGNVV